MLAVASACKVGATGSPDVAGKSGTAQAISVNGAGRPLEISSGAWATTPCLVGLAPANNRGDRGGGDGGEWRSHPCRPVRVAAMDGCSTSQCKLKVEYAELAASGGGGQA